VVEEALHLSSGSKGQLDCVFVCPFFFVLYDSTAIFLAPLLFTLSFTALAVHFSRELYKVTRK